MEIKKNRSYHSAIRQRQAEETRNRIASVAEALIKERGYEATTIGAIAEASGVAPQTVYAIFNSKQGILTYLLRSASSEAERLSDFKGLAHLTNVEEIAKELSKMMRRRGSERMSALNALGGVDILYPELARLVKEVNTKRRLRTVEAFREAIRLRGISVSPAQEKALTDVFWVFTDDKFYFMLVTEAGWSPDRYEELLQLVLELIMNKVAPQIVESFK